MQEQTRVREGLRRQKSEREEKGCQSAATGATLPAPTHNQCRRRKSSPLTLPRPAATSQCPPPENARGARAVRGNEHAAGLPKHCARVSQPVECTSPLLACANASMMSTPGMIGRPGKWPRKKLSFIVTFFTPTASFPGTGGAARAVQGDAGGRTESAKAKPASEGAGSLPARPSAHYSPQCAQRAHAWDRCGTKRGGAAVCPHHTR